MNRVLFFGTFDPLHTGHRNAFFQAKQLGEYLIVVVARDSAIVSEKKRTPHQREHKRLACVASDSSVDEVLLGDTEVASYDILKTVPFDILALGYDQTPSDVDVRTLLAKYGLSHVRIARLAAHKQHEYKSSLLRPV